MLPITRSLPSLVSLTRPTSRSRSAVVLSRLYFANTTMSSQGDLDATVQIPTVPVTALILKNLIADSESTQTPLLISDYNDRRRYEQPLSAAKSGSCSRSPRFKSPVHKRARVDRSTALHCVHILVLKHATPWLAAMSSNAIAMSADRQRRLAALLEKEKGELDADKQAMVKS